MQLTSLKKHLQSYFKLDKKGLDKISSCFELMKLEKNEYFLKEYALSKKLGFIHSGILREYTSDKNGKEVTKWISTESFFVMDIISFYFHVSARWNIQALTDCEIDVTDKSTLSELSDQIKNWDQIEKLFIVKCFGLLEERIVNQKSLNVEERYEK